MTARGGTHLIVLDDAHLRAVLTEFEGYYNPQRPHRSLRLETPQPVTRTRAGPIRVHPVLGGLHHACGRAA